MRYRLRDPLKLGAVMVGFLSLIVLVTKGPVGAVEMVIAGAVCIAAAAWYDSL